MRNETDDQSLNDWTVPSTVSSTAGGTESFIHLEDENKPALSLIVTPRNQSIGFFTSYNTTQVCVNVKASDLPDEDDETRSPVDIVVALDISVSMAGKRIKDCKRTLELMLRSLSSRDRLGLVSYGSNAKVEIPARHMTPENKASALQKIKAIGVNGSTNLSGGLSLAAQEMKLIGSPNTVRSIFLLTDGVANVGITRTADLVSMAKSLFATDDTPADEMGDIQVDDAASVDTKPKVISINKDPPVSLFCFGYGSHHNSDMLQAISSATPGGAYYFVEMDSDVSTAFGDAMGGLLSVVAQSTLVTISVPPTAAAKGVQILNVYHDEAINRGNGSYTVNVGDFYAEESRDVLFELQLSTAPSDTPVPHVMVSLSYMDTINKKPARFGPVGCVIGRPPTFDISPTDMHVEAQWLRIQTVREMEAADREAQSNNLAAAQRRMRDSLSLITRSPAYDAGSPMIMALMTDVQTVSAGFASTDHYRSVGSHAVKNKGTYLRQQRCMESSASTSNIYRNKKKEMFAKTYKK
jgi:Mg-chelatase subunit ChlD